MVETGTTKQEATDWCLSMGVKPSAMYYYCLAEHANCIGYVVLGP